MLDAAQKRSKSNALMPSGGRKLGGDTAATRGLTPAEVRAVPPPPPPLVEGALRCLLPLLWWKEPFAAFTLQRRTGGRGGVVSQVAPNGSSHSTQMMMRYALRAAVASWAHLRGVV